MGYQILYDTEIQNNPYTKARKSPFGLMVGSSFLFFLLLVSAFWPRGKDVLQGLIWPGERQMTIHAAECFARELRNGEPFGDAAERFCCEILTNAYCAD